MPNQVFSFRSTSEADWQTFKAKEGNFFNLKSYLMLGDGHLCQPIQIHKTSEGARLSTRRMNSTRLGDMRKGTEIGQDSIIL